MTVSTNLVVVDRPRVPAVSVELEVKFRRSIVEVSF